MLNFLIKSPVRRKVLGLFSLNPTIEFSVMDVSREIKEHPYAVGLELKALTRGEMLRTLRKGKRTVYHWNRESPYTALLDTTVTTMRHDGNQEMKNISDITRREKIQHTLKRVLHDLERYYRPEKIILFGSAAGGTIGPDSDIDLVIIKKTDMPFFKRSQELIDLLDYDIDIDFLVYTPEEFAQAVKERKFFSDEIVKAGKVLYEKTA